MPLDLGWRTVPLDLGWRTAGAPAPHVASAYGSGARSTVPLDQCSYSVAVAGYLGNSAWQVPSASVKECAAAACAHRVQAYSFCPLGGEGCKCAMDNGTLYDCDAAGNASTACMYGAVMYVITLAMSGVCCLQGKQKKTTGVGAGVAGGF